MLGSLVKVGLEGRSKESLRYSSRKEAFPGNRKKTRITHFEERMKRENQMDFKSTLDKRTFAVQCQKCRGRMGFEKFYGPNNSFYGWHCVLCGDILDPVILLHRLSRDADVSIPEREEDLLLLIKKYMKAKPKFHATAK
jgi:hypothetical protein